MSQREATTGDARLTVASFLLRSDLLCDQDDLYMPGVMASAMTAPG